MRYPLFFLILATYNSLLATHARGARLDLSSDVQIRALSYGNINFSASEPADHAFIAQNASLGFVVKDIKVEKSRDSSLDVGIVFNAVGVAGSTAPAKAPFDRIASRYPNTGFMPFIQQAYMRFNRAFDKDITMTLGRQSFALASGMTLSDDGLGFTGARVELPSLLGKGIKTELFAFEPMAAQIGQDTVDLYGASFSVPAEGLWQFYTFWENDKNAPSKFGTPVKSTLKQFSGVRYSLNYSFFSFDGEAAMQSGKATPSAPNANEIKFNGTAMLLKGKWTQQMGRLGTGMARIAVGRGSGDDPGTQDIDEAFFPNFGQRYRGIERNGFGAIFGSTLYDSIATSGTVSGLPGTASGVQLFSMGATLPPYRGFYTDIDMYFFKADRVVTGSKSIGSEMDIKITYPFGDKFKIQLIYASFSPDDIYPSGTKPVKLLALETSARF